MANNTRGADRKGGRGNPQKDNRQQGQKGGQSSNSDTDEKDLEEDME